MKKVTVSILLILTPILSILGYYGYGYWHVFYHEIDCSNNNFERVTLNIHSDWHDFFGVDPEGQCEKNRVSHDECEKSNSNGSKGYSLISGTATGVIKNFPQQQFKSDSARDAAQAYVSAVLNSNDGSKFNINTPSEPSYQLRARAIYFEDGKTYSVCAKKIEYDTEQARRTYGKQFLVDIKTIKKNTGERIMQSISDMLWKSSVNSATPKYDDSNIAYSYDASLSIWDGNELAPNPANNIYFFDPATKSNSSDQSQFTYAMQSYSNLTTVSFSLADPSDPRPDLVIYDVDMLTATRATTPQFSQANEDDAINNNQENAVLNPYPYSEFTRSEIAVDSNEDLSSDAWGIWFALHEVGHSLGITHPDNDSLNQDYNTLMTVMSELKHTSHVSITPMAYDVAAIDQLYGASSVNSEDGTTFNEANLYLNEATDNLALAIVDTGGLNDVINLSNVTGSHKIDLRQAIDDQEQWTGYKTVINSQVNDDKEWIYIAKDSVIENAEGGAGGDEIRGNDANNNLKGNGGDDDLHGSEGNDTLVGGAGADKLYGGTGGWDVADYTSHNEAVSLTLDNVGAFDFIVTGGTNHGTDELQSVEIIKASAASTDTINLGSDTSKVTNIYNYGENLVLNFDFNGNGTSTSYEFHGFEKINFSTGDDTINVNGLHGIEYDGNGGTNSIIFRAPDTLGLQAPSLESGEGLVVTSGTVTNTIDGSTYTDFSSFENFGYAQINTVRG